MNGTAFIRPRRLQAGLAPAACLLLALSLAACGGSASATHRGHFSYGFETSAFRPCNSDEVWWVTGEGANALIEQYGNAAPADYEEVYAEVRGQVSEPGSYGHLGAYQRELSVTEVVEVRAKGEEDCG
jgi:hypothetical protein